MPQLHPAVRGVQGNLSKLLRFWFTLDEPVDRRTYFVHGFTLALVKYLVDLALIWTIAGVEWTPFDYLTTGASFERSKFAHAPSYLPIALALWTLPFFWIGLTLSTRRARDAGISPWFAQLFFVPFVNYAFMAAMSLAPSRPRDPVSGEVPLDEEWLPSALRAIGVGTGAGLAMVALSVLAIKSYGAAVFFGTPLVMGAVTAYVFNRSYAGSTGETLRVVLLSLLLTAGALIAFAIEGAACVIMSFPLALVIAFLGAVVGRRIALDRSSTPREAFIVVLLVPLSAPLVDSQRAPMLHEVRSAVEIAAPPATVWRNVIAFPRLDEPTDLVFRSGIAYPLSARIEGTGVGAMRYCEFSTGAFVEPITHWEPGRRLSFDVVENPPAMREWSPYDIAPPHLDGYFTARRGEFRLVTLANGHTRLEGSTWYELEMAPQPYWSPMADALVERIHQRVLRHIKTVAEREAAAR